MIHRLLLKAFFLTAALSPHLPLSLSAQGWEAVQAEKFDGSGFSANLGGVPGFHAVGFVRGTYGASGVPGDTCALLQPYAAGSLVAMKTDLETGFEYRIQLNTKSFGQGSRFASPFIALPVAAARRPGRIYRCLPLAPMILHFPAQAFLPLPLPRMRRVLTG